jgi:hypothetical protein
MKNVFDPIKNSPITLEVFDAKGETALKTSSLNEASDKKVSLGVGATIVVTDCKGNTRVL